MISMISPKVIRQLIYPNKPKPKALTHLQSRKILLFRYIFSSPSTSCSYISFKIDSYISFGRLLLLFLRNHTFTFPSEGCPYFSFEISLLHFLQNDALTFCTTSYFYISQEIILLLFLPKPAYNHHNFSLIVQEYPDRMDIYSCICRS